MKLWMWKYRGKTLIGDAFRTRAEAIDFAVQRGITSTEYEALVDNSARWKLAYRRGHRIVRVTVSEEVSDG